jgi:hypothetical protein
METGTCLRCGTPYEPDATVCYTCGAPIGETKTPTQPVRAVKTPTAAPEPEPEPEPAVSASPLPISPAPPTGPLASTRVHLAIPAQSSIPVKRPRRRWPIALLICALLLAALGSAAYVVHGITASPQVAQQVTYHDPQHRFSFLLRGLWQATATPDGAIASDASGSSTVTITIAVPTTPATATQEADRQAAKLGLHSDTSVTVAGQSWEQRTGQVTGSDGAVRQVTVLVTVHAGQLYTIQFSSPIASYSGVNTLVFQPLLATFTFD